MMSTRHLQSCHLDPQGSVPTDDLDPQVGSPTSLLVGTCQCRSEEHTSELQSLRHLVCRLLLEKKKRNVDTTLIIRTTNVRMNLALQTSSCAGLQPSARTVSTPI